MIKKITSGDKLIAIIIPRDFHKDGVEFFSPKEFSQQLGYMKHPKGYKIQQGPYISAKVDKERFEESNE